MGVGAPVGRPRLPVPAPDPPEGPVDRAGGSLAEIVAEVLRAWPLSGVLSDLDDPPVDLGALGTEPGLLMLYAERLVEHDRPSWSPRGLAREYVELVREKSGRGLPGHEGVAVA